MMFVDDGTVNTLAGAVRREDIPVVRLPHWKLGMTERELEALLWVRNELASGRMKHLHHWAETSLTEPDMFNMGVWQEFHECGSVACIGGWMSARLSLNANDEAWLSSKLRVLFHPPMELSWDSITPEQAVRAIDNFTTREDPCWISVVEE